MYVCNIILVYRYNIIRCTRAHTRVKRVRTLSGEMHVAHTKCCTLVLPPCATAKRNIKQTQYNIIIVCVM